jgi:hypothetical protein
MQKPDRYYSSENPSSLPDLQYPVHLFIQFNEKRVGMPLIFLYPPTPGCNGTNHERNEF